MELYLMRHGIAAERQPQQDDAARPLTEQGRQKTLAIAQRLAGLSLHFDAILTSPLIRARQTADILRAAGLSDTLAIEPLLSPGGLLETWLEQVGQQRGDRLMLVGHAPDLSHWAERLLWNATKETIVLKKAGIIGLSLPETGSFLGHSQLIWLTPPRFLL